MGVAFFVSSSNLVLKSQDRSRRFDVTGDLVFQRIDPVELLLGTEELDELDLEFFSVNLMFQTKKIHLEETFHGPSLHRRTIPEVGDAIPSVSGTRGSNGIDSRRRQLFSMDREIGRRKPNRPSKLASLDDSSKDGVGAPKKSLRDPEVPCPDRFTNPGAGHPHPLQLDGLDGRDFEIVDFPDLAQKFRRPRASLAETPILADADSRDPLSGRSRQERVHELFSGFLTEILGKRHHQQIPDSHDTPEKMQLVSRRRQQSWCILGRKNLDGMRIKGHDNYRAAPFLRRVDRGLDHRLVTEMNPIKNSDREVQGSRDVIQRIDLQHDVHRTEREDSGTWD